jgi:hypothetical protein
VQVSVGKDYRLSADTAKKYINSNTILIVASSPGFPHGVMDDVSGLAKVSSSVGCGWGGVGGGGWGGEVGWRAVIYFLSKVGPHSVEHVSFVLLF